MKKNESNTEKIIGLFEKTAERNSFSSLTSTQEIIDWQKNYEITGNRIAALESNIIIEASKNLIDLKATLIPYSNLFISIVSYVEVIGFDFINKDEENFILGMLSEFPIIDTSKDTADIAVGYRKKKKMKLPDPFILATTSYLNADLLTNNVSDFEELEENINIVVPTC